MPVRLEVGPRDLAEGQVTLVRRDTGAKRPVPVTEMLQQTADALDASQVALLEAALEWRDTHTQKVSSVVEAIEAASTGFARLPLAELGEGGEAALAQQGVTVRCLQTPDGALPERRDAADVEAVVGRAY